MMISKTCSFALHHHNYHLSSHGYGITRSYLCNTVMRPSAVLLLPRSSSALSALSSFVRPSIVSSSSLQKPLFISSPSSIFRVSCLDINNQYDKRISNRCNTYRLYHSSTTTNHNDDMTAVSNNINDAWYHQQLSSIQLQVIAELKRWRLDLSKQSKKPLYLIMHNKVMDSIAKILPLSSSMLIKIPGIGSKTMQYADVIMNIIDSAISAYSNNDSSSVLDWKDFHRYLDEYRAKQQQDLLMPPPPQPLALAKPKKKRSTSKTTDFEMQERDLDALYSSMMTASQLTDDQREIANKILSSSSSSTRDNYFISGSAGTGKSFLLKYIIQELRRRYGNEGVAVTAPTGVAAIHVGGSTIHSFAGIGIGKGSPEAIIQKVLDSAQSVKRWRQAKALIIDEISMVDVHLFQLLDEVARTARRRDEPFGGLQVIAVGDFLQLPPVTANLFGNSGPVEGDGDNGHAQQGHMRFCFQSKAWKDAGLLERSQIIQLDEVLRQGDVKHSEILNRIRRGILKADDLEILNKQVIDFKPLPKDGIIPTRLYCTNKDVDAENLKQLALLPGDIVTVTATDTWVRKSNTSKSAADLLPPHIKKWLTDTADKCTAPTVDLKIGAQVMLLRNRVEDRRGAIGDGDGGDFYGTGSISNGDHSSKSTQLVNGSRGIVIGFVESFSTSTKMGGMVPVVKFDCGRVERIDKVETNFMGPLDSDVMLVRHQIPLRLAWAITVHKSQGSTLSRAELMISNAFDYGQAYVALSRVSSLQGLWLTKPLSRRSIFVHPAVLNFYGYDEEIPL